MAHLAQSTPLALGATAPDFALPGTDGKEYALAECRGAQCTVITFSCNHCPYVKAYDERLNDLAKRYVERGVSFLAINSNDAASYPSDSFEKMGEKVDVLGLVYPYLHDATQQVALRYGAGCTPEFFVFNSDLELVYTGRLDDNMEEPTHVTKAYVQDAIDAVLAGKLPSVQQSHPIGCSIKWARANVA